MKKILYIGNKLSKKGSNTTYIETLGPLLESEGYQITYASDVKNQFLRMLDMMVKTIRNIQNVEVVIIDTYSTFSFYYTVIISLICRIFNRKYICILHGGKLPIRLKKSPFLCQHVFFNAYKNVAPSQYLFNSFSKKFSANLTYIPNTVDLQNYPKCNKEFSAPRLFWLRSFSEIYNPRMAIKVLGQLRLHYPDAQLIMIGPNVNGMLEKCKQLATDNQLEVTFTGKLDKKDWVEQSKNYNIFINTTHLDNTPLSLLEAMSLGFPIVSTNVGGIPYLVQHNHSALLVNDNDEKAMSAEIQRLITNKRLRDDLIHNASELVKQFDWKVVRLKWFDILH
jgi:L-malate glycosyltransferase